MLTLVSDSLDTYRNLAIEDYLLDRAEQVAPALFLWRSRCAVVIGKHQNPWRECRLATLQAMGGYLARRVSGGGAVYHDTGNLNYAFICRRDKFEKNLQYSLVSDALGALGLQAHRLGKSNIAIADRKISGNAFCHRRRGVLHHGTLLVNTDLGRIPAVLTHGDDVYDTHAVPSEPAPVVNLRDFVPDITTETVANALTDAFRAHYGAPEPARSVQPLDEKELARRKSAMQTWDWCFGRTPAFTVKAGHADRVDGIRATFRVEKGYVVRADVTSDRWGPSVSAWLAGTLSGCPFDSHRLAVAVRLAAERTVHRADAEEFARWVSTRGY